MTPLELSRLREQALIDGLHAFAAQHGFTWQGSLRINSLGEFDLAVQHPTEQYTKACGHLGTAATVINKHNPRCGIRPGAILDEQAGWFMLNHFDAERLLRETGHYTEPE